jgi:hypothetical protein
MMDEFTIEWGARWINGGVEQGSEQDSRDTVADYPEDTVLVQRQVCTHGFLGPWKRVR